MNIEILELRARNISTKEVKIKVYTTGRRHPIGIMINGGDEYVFKDNADAHIFLDGINETLEALL